jgi:toxin-antitoxin system PIN domain toxin
MPGSPRSFLFPDINVWVALTYGGHVHHSIAKYWFESLGPEDRICFCRFTQIGLLRLLSTQAVMGADEVMTQVDAWKAYDRWRHDDRILFIEEPQGIEESFRSLTREHHPHPKIWADAYLAAFAVVLEMQLVTFDQGFRRINGVRILKQ